MRVLDLFSGMGGWSAPFRDDGHETFSIDINRAFEADAHIDCGDVGSVLSAVPWRPDIILASPPCTSFTTMTMGRNWTHDGEPRTESARQGRRLVLSTLRVIAALLPRFWIIENPRARLRTLGLLDGFGPCSNGSPCHIAAPRGSRTGTQGGVDSARAGLIPYALAALVRDAAKESFA